MNTIVVVSGAQHSVKTKDLVTRDTRKSRENPQTKLAMTAIEERARKAHSETTRDGHFFPKYKERLRYSFLPHLLTR
jgi:hypothetical protein